MLVRALAAGAFLLLPLSSFADPVIKVLVEGAAIRELALENHPSTYFIEHDPSGTRLASVVDKATATIGSSFLTQQERLEILQSLKALVQQEKEFSALPLETQKNYEKYRPLSPDRLVSQSELAPELSEKRRFFRGLQSRAETALASGQAGTDSRLASELKRITAASERQLSHLGDSVTRRALEIEAGASANLANPLDVKAIGRIEENYKSKGLLQELIWFHEQVGMPDKAGSEKQTLREALAHTSIKSKLPIDVGRNDVLLVELEGGVSGVFKSSAGGNFKREIAGYQIDQLFSFGYVPMTVERTIDGQKGSLQYFVRDARNPRDMLYPWVDLMVASKQGGEIKELDFAQLLKEPRKMAAYDHLSSHGDRWPRDRNFMRRPSGQAIAIDNESVFRPQALVQNLNDQVKAAPLEFHPGDDVLSKLRNVPDDQIRAALSPYGAQEDIDELIKKRHALYGAINSPATHCIKDGLQHVLGE